MIGRCLVPKPAKCFDSNNDELRMMMVTPPVVVVRGRKNERARSEAGLRDRAEPGVGNDPRTISTLQPLIKKQTAREKKRQDLFFLYILIQHEAIETPTTLRWFLLAFVFITIHEWPATRTATKTQLATSSLQYECVLVTKTQPPCA
jgi:hypothetical protein